MIILGRWGRGGEGEGLVWGGRLREGRDGVAGSKNFQHALGCGLETTWHRGKDV